MAGELYHAQKRDKAILQKLCSATLKLFTECALTITTLGV